MARITVYIEDNPVMKFKDANIDATDIQTVIYTKPGSFTEVVRIFSPIIGMNVKAQKTTLTYPDAMQIVISTSGKPHVDRTL